MRSRSLLTATLCSLTTLLGFAACSRNDDTTLVSGPDLDGDGVPDFVSTVPYLAIAEPPPEHGGAKRAIADAQIVQRDGDRIYAVSRFGGLTVVDASDPRALRRVGNYRVDAEPLELYVEGTTLFVLLNASYEYPCGASYLCLPQATGRVQALDVADPSAIVRLADRKVPGRIVDSRRSGDVLYLATLENGTCLGCDTSSNVTLTSFDVSERTVFEPIDQLRFPAPLIDYTYTGPRTVAITPERIYVSGWEWDDSALAPTGTIQVVDITDPAGDLVAGATLPLAGLVQSRWQMDEHAGVLRVISQAESTSESVPPVLETFRVGSASDVQRLAGSELAPPHPNAVLESVRFDGERAYAVTLERGNLEQSQIEQSQIEQGDALLAFDLSAPESPRQVGELEVPGRVRHLEPRGDRLFAFGFDAEDEAAPIHVSLFDVSDLDTPALSSRVSFGGAFASLARSPERLDEAFAMLDDIGLILVSVAAGSPLDESCSLEYESGIQLVDFTRDSLTKRGVAPQVGSARRALIHRDHLFGVGANTLQTFDITDRDAPVATARLDVARNVSNARVLGDHLLRFGNDWWTNQTTLEMTPLERATEAQPQADIDLSALFGENAWGCTDETEWTGQAFTKGDYAYVPRISVGYSSPDEAEYRLALYVIDLRDRAAPKPIGSIEIEPFGAQTSFTGIIQTESTLLVGRKVTSGSDYPYYRFPADPPRPNPRLYYDVIDLREPSAPELVHRLEVPEQLALGGFGYYHGLLGTSVDLGSSWWHGDQNGSGGGALTDGDLVISQHFEHVEGWPHHARYFMDRLDVSNPREPVFLPKVNVPGNVVHFDADTGSIATLDTHTSLEAASAECSERGAWGGYVEERRCVLLRRTLSSLVLGGERAVLQNQVALDESERTVGIAVSDQRLFYLTLPFADVQPLVTPTPTLHTLDLAGGSFAALPPVPLEPARDGYYDSPHLLRARGTRAFMSTPSRLDVVDTSDPSSPLQGAFALPAYTSCSALDVSAEAAYCALGQRGVEAFDLSAMR